MGIETFMILFGLFHISSAIHSSRKWTLIGWNVGKKRIHVFACIQAKTICLAESLHLVTLQDRKAGWVPNCLRPTVKGKKNTDLLMNLVFWLWNVLGETWNSTHSFFLEENTLREVAFPPAIMLKNPATSSMEQKYLPYSHMPYKKYDAAAAVDKLCK